MNCQDIARILDERELESLLSEEIPDLQAHLAVCRECARAWKVHEQLTSIEIPAVPAELRAFFPQTGGASRAGEGRRSRFVLIGVVVAVAAAAAMLTAGLMKSPVPVAVTASPVPAESSSVQVGVDALPSTDTVAPAKESAQPIAEAQTVPVAERATTAGLRILLMPPRFDSGDATARSAIEGFQSSLLQALRRSPDITVDLASAVSPTEPPANRITVISPEVIITASGQSSYRHGSGSGSWMLGYGAVSPAWAVEVMVEPANSSTSGNTRSGFGGQAFFSAQLFIGIDGVPDGGACGGFRMNMQSVEDGSRNQNAGKPACSRVDRLAARIIQTLREKLEPPTDTTRLSSRLSDTSLGIMERLATFTELLGRSRQSAVVLDAAAIDAIRAYVVEALANKGLSATERLAPAVRLYGMPDAAGADAIGKISAVMDLDEFTRQLRDIFHDLRVEARQPVAGVFPGGFAGQQQPDESMRRIVSLLTRVNPSAAVDLQISILTDNPRPPASITMQALTVLIGKRDDPRVSKVLDDVAAGKSGPELRSQLEARQTQDQQTNQQPFRGSPPAVEQEF